MRARTFAHARIMHLILLKKFSQLCWEASVLQQQEEEPVIVAQERFTGELLTDEKWNHHLLIEEPLENTLPQRYLYCPTRLTVQVPPQKQFGRNLAVQYL